MRNLMLVAVAALVLASCTLKDSNGTPAANTATTAAVTPGLPSTPQAAQSPVGPSLGQATDAKGEVRMDVTDVVRSGGVLTIKTRFTLVGGKPGSRALPGGSTDEVYLTAGDKKYLLLKDDHDKALASSNAYPNFDQVGSAQTWWGKFPAPAAEIKAVNVYFYTFEPVENVAVADR